jgi:hypothetical protein
LSTVTLDMIRAVERLFALRTAASVEHDGKSFVIGYREGRDVSVIARGETWDAAWKQAEDRSRLVDHLVKNTGSTNSAVATAACVPVRFVRIRRRDLGA